MNDFTQATKTLDAFCSENNDKLSVLLNNAGILEIGAFQDISNEQHPRILNVNVMGVINLSQAAWLNLKNSTQSTIINMSSASSDYGVPELASYSASKFAVKAPKTHRTISLFYGVLHTQFMRFNQFFSHLCRLS